MSWYRNAGAKRLHKGREDWIDSGLAVCGADIGRPYVRGSDHDMPLDGHFHTKLSDYPRRYGLVACCKKCLKKGS